MPLSFSRLNKKKHPQIDSVHTTDTTASLIIILPLQQHKTQLNLFIAVSAAGAAREREKTKVAFWAKT
jgi:hypothetical protein